MSSLLFWGLALAALAVAIAVASVFARAYARGASPSSFLFGAKVEPRIGVVEYANVDGRRKLLLVRRDEVEHLIMTGGPVDVVIETGIAPPRLAYSEPSGAIAGERAAPSFGPVSIDGTRLDLPNG